MFHCNFNLLSEGHLTTSRCCLLSSLSSEFLVNLTISLQHLCGITTLPMGAIGAVPSDLTLSSLSSDSLCLCSNSSNLSRLTLDGSFLTLLITILQISISIYLSLCLTVLPSSSHSKCSPPREANKYPHLTAFLSRESQTLCISKDIK